MLFSVSVLHYENMPMQYTEIFFSSKIETFIGKQIHIINIFVKALIVGTR